MDAMIGRGLRRVALGFSVLGGACAGDAGHEAAEVLGADVVADVGADGEATVATDPFVVPPIVSLDALHDAFGRARCRFDARCEVGYAGTEPATCIASAGDYAWMVEAVERQVARGRLAYDASAMGQCLSWLAERPCDAVGIPPDDTAWAGGYREYFARIVAPDWLSEAACRRAFLGDGGPGAACLEGVECTSGTCLGADRQACGVCAGNGAACASSDVCATDERCNTDLGHCVPRVPVGGACGRDSDCLSSSRCEGAQSSAGTCVGLGPIGRACDDANFGAALCPVGSRCVGRVCQALAYPRFVGEGGGCADGANGQQCRPDLRRSDDEPPVCERRETGDACAYYNQTDSRLARMDGCALTDVCDAKDTCAPPRAGGASCRDGRDCGAGLYCEPTGHTCAPRLGEGATCRAYPLGGQCAYPLVCVGSRLGGTPGTCQLGGKPGDPCGGKEDCAADLTCYEGGSHSVCAFYGASFFGCR